MMQPNEVGGEKRGELKEKSLSPGEKRGREGWLERPDRGI